MDTISLGAGLGAALGVTVVVTLVVMAVELVAAWKVFEKAGKPGWHAIIPFLNVYDLFDMAWDKKFGLIFIGASLGNSIVSVISQNMDGTVASLFAFVALILVIAMIGLSVVVCFKLATAFGQGTEFGFGILFLSFIFMPILAFGDSEYIGNESTFEGGPEAR